MWWSIVLSLCMAPLLSVVFEPENWRQSDQYETMQLSAKLQAVIGKIYVV